jgi:proteasome lid subunit RPN8/RPN11
VFVEIEESGLELVGIYHSHPQSPAYPSPRDVDMAYYPEAAYLIVSLGEMEAPIMRAFRIEDEQITEQVIEVL